MKTVRTRKEEELDLELEVEKISAPLLREKPSEPLEENESGYHGSSSPPPPPSSYQPFGEENSPVEQVALTVTVTDDPTLTVVTFRVWTLACVLLSFLNQFFWFRREPLFISSISAQIAVVPLGRLMASAVTRRVFFKGRKWEFSLNPGPFNVKERLDHHIRQLRCRRYLLDFHRQRR